MGLQPRWSGLCAGVAEQCALGRNGRKHSLCYCFCDQLGVILQSERAKQLPRPDNLSPMASERHRSHNGSAPVRALRAVASGWRRFKLWYKSLYHGRPWWFRLFVVLATAVVSVLLLLLAVDMNFLWLFGKSPSVHAIMHPRTAEASYIYSGKIGNQRQAHGLDQCMLDQEFL